MSSFKFAENLDNDLEQEFINDMTIINGIQRYILHYVYIYRYMIYLYISDQK